MSLIDRCRDRWADLHPFWHIVLVAVLLAALALAAGRPALEVYLELRTGRRLAAAQEALGRRLHFKAFDLALQGKRSTDGRRADLAAGAWMAYTPDFQGVFDGTAELPLGQDLR